MVEEFLLWNSKIVMASTNRTLIFIASNSIYSNLQFEISQLKEICSEKS